MVPYANEHSCRMKEPGDFQANSFRRMVNGKLTMIIGKLKGESSTTVQAYRYPTDDWDEPAAREHCKKAGGSFEAAKKE
jgi:hypothetical protein